MLNFSLLGPEEEENLLTYIDIPETESEPLDNSLVLHFLNENVSFDAIDPHIHDDNNLAQQEEPLAVETAVDVRALNFPPIPKKEDFENLASFFQAERVFLDIKLQDVRFCHILCSLLGKAHQTIMKSDALLLFSAGSSARGEAEITVAKNKCKN